MPKEFYTFLWLIWWWNCPRVAKAIKLSRDTVLELCGNGARAFINQSALRQQCHVSKMSS